jgi:hypothetical protein
MAYLNGWVAHAAASTVTTPRGGMRKQAALARMPAHLIHTQLLIDHAETQRFIKNYVENEIEHYVCIFFLNIFRRDGCVG